MCCQSQLHFQTVPVLSKICYMFRLFHKATLRHRHKNIRGNEPPVLHHALLSELVTHTPGFFFFLRCVPTRAMAFPFTRFLDHTQRPTTVGRTPLDESEQLVAETSTWQHTTLTTDRHQFPPAGIGTPNTSRRAAADPRFWPCGHRDRLIVDSDNNTKHKNIVP
jgi:hypothetical protein